MILLWAACIKDRDFHIKHWKVFNIGDYELVSSALAAGVSYYLTHEII